MLFQSIEFFLFFALFLIGLPFFKNNTRIIYITLASYIFYAWWFPPYIFLLFSLTLLGFFLARYVNNGKIMLGAIITIILLPLCFFKYSGFILSNIEVLLGINFNFKTSWQLPLGISFITFTIIAYLIDVKRQIRPIEKSFFNFAMYISFFPQLIAGPIMRPHELLPQLKNIHINKKMLKLGFFLFSIGMVKKVVFADQIAIYVDRFYTTDTPTIITSLFAFYGFAIQIYCDFSGYMDMAAGLAFMLNVRLPLNFNRPYLASSIREFWKKWHITLSRWLKDYLYIPLGGNRKGTSITIINLAITMILGGLWHGAAWTFIFWGAYHGLWLIIEHQFKGYRNFLKNSPILISQILIFHIVCIGWVLFRARSWNEVTQLFSGFLILPSDFSILSSIIFQIILIILCIILHRWDRMSFICWIAKRTSNAIILPLIFIFILLSFVMSIGNPSAFIYFDF